MLLRRQNVAFLGAIFALMVLSTDSPAQMMSGPGFSMTPAYGGIGGMGGGMMHPGMMPTMGRMPMSPFMGSPMMGQMHPMQIQQLIAMQNARKLQMIRMSGAYYSNRGAMQIGAGSVRAMGLPHFANIHGYHRSLQRMGL